MSRANRTKRANKAKRGALGFLVEQNEESKKNGHEGGTNNQCAIG